MNVNLQIEKTLMWFYHQHHQLNVYLLLCLEFLINLFVHSYCNSFIENVKIKNFTTFKKEELQLEDKKPNDPNQPAVKKSPEKEGDE